MSDQRFVTATSVAPPQPVTPPTTISPAAAEFPAVTPLSPAPLSTLSEAFTTLELEMAHHENTLYNIQTTLTTTLPVTQQTTLNILSSIENAAEDLWSLKQQYERANVALLRLRLDNVRPNSSSNSSNSSNSDGEHNNNEEELDQMKKVAEMISKSLKWAEEFRMELGRRTDAVYFAAGDLEGIEVGDADGELEVVRGGRGGLSVVCANGVATVGEFVECLWDDGGSDETAEDDALWDTGENTANMI